jgi:dTDP-4-amino-4,6-dideoxygalactose transaminase
VKVPFFDRTRADAALLPELEEAFRRVVRSGMYVLGAEVEALERELAASVGVRHAVAVSSGTDALLASLVALGVGPGHEVICPAYTFFATVEGVVRLGATPVFADVVPASLTLDSGRVAALLGPRTRAILPVHLFGRCADMPALLDVAEPRGVPIVEDAAQALGAKCGGARAGSIGALGCFSFFPTKNLGGFGDGGLVTTNDDALATQVRSLRNHGARTKNVHERIGGNFRLDALQAALLRVGLRQLPAAVARRRAIAAAYREHFRELDLGPSVQCLAADPGATYNQFVVRVRGPEGARDRVRGRLSERGIGTEVYYPTPLNRQPCFRGEPCHDQRFVVAEAASSETLALPVFPELTDGEIRVVSEMLAQAVRLEAKP